MALQGSEKQIAWAEQIRDTYVAKATAEALRISESEARRSGRGNPQRAAYAERLAQAVKAAEAIAEARFWIDNRASFEAGPLANTRGADLIISAAR